MNRATAVQLADLIRDAVPDVSVHTDPDSAQSAAQSGLDTIIINPPTLEYPTRYAATATWSIWLVPGPSTRNEAWDNLDVMLSQLAAAVDIETARPVEWQPTNHGPHMPAYDVTITTDHDL